MMDVKVALAGIGGYGRLYVEEMLKSSGKSGFSFIAAVDPFPNSSAHFPELQKRGIPVYPDLDAMYASVKPDLLALSTPIHLHDSQSRLALSKGSSVLCEKPVAGSLAEAESMLKSEKESGGRFLAIGYQWSFSDAVQSLKTEILAGRLGRPLRLKTVVFWPRALSYYKRNSWAGALETPDGCPVNDSPLNNATAHYLHNCLYVLGSSMGSSARVSRMQAELYRVNSIQNYDTAAVRCEAAGAEILFYTTHAVKAESGPVACYEFEDACVGYDNSSGVFFARMRDGSTRVYGNPGDNVMKKLHDCVDALRAGTRPLCCVEAASEQTRCMEAAKRSMPEVSMPGPSWTETAGTSLDPLTCIKGIQDSFTLCYSLNALPSELPSIKWAKPGAIVEV